MKLYDNSWAPNPRRVRIFMAEKGIDLPRTPIDLRSHQHRQADYTAVNALQELPALELDDGTIITESLAICRYLDALHPQPALFGATPVEIAMVEMWGRRLELHLLASISAVFRHLHPAMAAHESPQVAAWGEANKLKTAAFLDLLDRHLATHRFVAGDAFSVADITGFVAMDFMKPARLPWPDHIEHVRRWHSEIASRPSAAA
jgi:glutathione S-transferase